jgi:glyoxalase family protein
MSLDVKGLHHFTAIASDPTENAKFYVKTLGLRMVKKTVNHDAPQMYHLFYGDNEGTPGSNITFFPEMTDQKGKPGAGMVTELGLRIPEGSINYWSQRLEDKEIDFEKQQWQGKQTLKFKDNSGLTLRLVPDSSKNYKPWDKSSVPEKHQIQGMNHVTVSVRKLSGIEPILNEMGLEKTGDYENTYFNAKDGSGVEVKEADKQGTMGIGSVHHIAFKAGETEQKIENWRAKLKKMGMRPSPAISRKYFTSTYARTPVGVLFEFSSMGPGYTADEPVEDLGTNLVLPEKLESRREQIETALPEFDEEQIR